MADDVDDSDEGVSPICLRINTSITISSDNNMVCLADTPASHAKAIAHAVVKALQESSSGQCGIPMIDEDGRPRPVRINVDAGMTVGGTGNVVGNETVIREVVRQQVQTQTRRRRRPESEADEDGESNPWKRRRASR